MDFENSRAMERYHETINNFLDWSPNLLVAIVVFLIFYLIARLVRFAAHRFTEKKTRIRNAGLAIGRLVQGFILFLGLLFALTAALPTFKPADIVSFLGIGSVAIGFAFRDILQNFLAGILLLITQPFHIDDQIVVEDFEGTVEDIQTRATLLRTYDGRRIVIPNSTLFTNKVIVNTAYGFRRIEYDFGIGYSDDIELAKQIILEVIRGNQEILKEPAPDALVVKLDSSSVNIRARWWIRPPRRADALDSRDEIIAKIKDKFQDNGIDLPFPTRQVLFHDQTEETDGDRSQQREGWPEGQSKIPKERKISSALLEVKENVYTSLK
jgi:small-conductance mechanosensitive channel